MPPESPLRAAPDPPGSLAAFLDADEDLLRQAIPSARATSISAVSVSVGVATPSSAAFVRRIQADGGAVAYRHTGGSGVLHLPGDLVWSVVLPRSDPRVGRDFTRAFGRLGEGAVRFLARRSLGGSWSPSPALAPDYCVLSGRGQVLTVNDRVLGGAAQHATPRALLHHGTIAGRIEPDRLRRWFGIEEPSTIDRLTGLEELGVRDPPERLAAELEEELRASLGWA